MVFSVPFLQPMEGECSLKSYEGYEDILKNVEDIISSEPSINHAQQANLLKSIEHFRIDVEEMLSGRKENGNG